MRAAVFVEGTSDRAALEALARRRGRDLAAEGVSIVPIGGAQALGRALASSTAETVAGLVDAGQERDYARALERAGLGEGLTRETMEALGFYVCDSDLEDELIRALGAEAVEEIVADHGELGPFRTFQHQPFYRERTREQQLHRFIGTRAGRKVAYARYLVDALDLARVPRPLDRVLASV
jgi:hypothetical protein